MGYVKNFESFRNSKNTETPVNEEFIGGLLKKLSLGFSKMFGTAKEVDNLIKRYRKEIEPIQLGKNKILLQLKEYIAAEKEGGDDKDFNVNDLTKKYQTAEKNFNEQLENLKKKFDMEFKEIVKKEKNEKIKNYINLKKIELQQELLKKEMGSLFDDETSIEKEADIEAMEIDDSVKNIMKKILAKNKNLENRKNKEVEYLKRTEEVAGFDEEEAKKNPDYEGWDKFVNKVFKKDDKVKYFSTSRKEIIEGTVDEKSNADDEKVSVRTDKGTFKIDKSFITEKTENKS
jgi:hypothetical protein